MDADEMFGLVGLSDEERSARIQQLLDFYAHCGRVVAELNRDEA